MARITSEQSREIYEISKNPRKNLTNSEIGKMYGIDEATVRYHTRKWEKRLRSIASANDKAANALVSHAVNVSEESLLIIREVKNSIQEAKSNSISPEKLAPLYNNWIKSLELASEILGDVNRAPIVNLQINEQIIDFIQVVLEEVDDHAKNKIISKLEEIAGFKMPESS